MSCRSFWWLSFTHVDGFGGNADPSQRPKQKPTQEPGTTQNNPRSTLSSRIDFVFLYTDNGYDGGDIAMPLLVHQSSRLQHHELSFSFVTEFYPYRGSLQ